MRSSEPNPPDPIDLSESSQQLSKALLSIGISIRIHVWAEQLNLRVSQVGKLPRISEEDLAAFRALPRPVKVVVLAEDWCGDVIANLPVLGRLAKDSGKLDVRIFLRDQNDDIMQRYLNKGQFKSIPVFVFFDDAFRELGHWIERPASVTEVRAKRRKEIFAAHPEFGSPDAPVDQLAAPKSTCPPSSFASSRSTA